MRGEGPTLLEEGLMGSAAPLEMTSCGNPAKPVFGAGCGAALSGFD